MSSINVFRIYIYYPHTEAAMHALTTFSDANLLVHKASGDLKLVILPVVSVMQFEQRT